MRHARARLRRKDRRATRQSSHFIRQSTFANRDNVFSLPKLRDGCACTLGLRPEREGLGRCAFEGGRVAAGASLEALAKDDAALPNRQNARQGRQGSALPEALMKEKVSRGLSTESSRAGSLPSWAVTATPAQRDLSGFGARRAEASWSSELPNVPDGSTELAYAHMNLRNIRAALARPAPGPRP